MGILCSYKKKYLNNNYNIKELFEQPNPVIGVVIHVPFSVHFPNFSNKRGLLLSSIIHALFLCNTET